RAKARITLKIALAAEVFSSLTPVMGRFASLLPPVRARTLSHIDEKRCRINSRPSYSTGELVSSEITLRLVRLSGRSLQADRRSVDFPEPLGPAMPMLPPG